MIKRNPFSKQNISCTCVKLMWWTSRVVEEAVWLPKLEMFYVVSCCIHLDNKLCSVLYHILLIMTRGFCERFLIHYFTMLFVRDEIRTK